MKTCPVCKACCFEDMEVCFGCMHRFDEKSEKGQPELLTTQIPMIEETNWNPRHAAEKSMFSSNNQINQPETSTQVVLPVLEEGKLQAEYQLVISLKPV